jgi:hypothetical protein
VTGRPGAPPPDTSEWPRFFEPLLDALLPIFRPDLAPAVTPPSSDRLDDRRRCSGKRSRLAEGLRDAPAELVREHAGPLLNAVLHDLNSSHNVLLIDPLVAVLGRRAVQEAIITAVETGTIIEQSAATMAWYAAQASAHFPTVDAFERGEATPESRAAIDVVADLRTRYRDACLRALASCRDPRTRERLSHSMSSGHEVVRIGH